MDAQRQEFICILDNLFANQQSLGITTEIHNVLSEDHIKKMFNAEQLSRNTSTNFKKRLLFCIAIPAAIRPSEIYQVKCYKLTIEFQGKMKVVRIKIILSLIHI